MSNKTNPAVDPPFPWLVTAKRSRDVGLRSSLRLGLSGAFDDLKNVLLLVDELLVLLIVVEVGEEGHEPLSIPSKDVLHHGRLLGVCDELPGKGQASVSDVDAAIPSLYSPP